MIETLPAPVLEMLAVEFSETPFAPVPVPHEVLLTVIEPELVVTQLESIIMPRAIFVPFAAVPVIVTLPEPIAEMLVADREMPVEYCPVPHEVPLTVIEPELVVT